MPTEKLPECDIEIKVFQKPLDRPKVKRFTFRPRSYKGGIEMIPLAESDLDSSVDGPQVLLKYQTRAAKDLGQMEPSEYREWRESGGGSEQPIPVLLSNLADIPAIDVNVHNIVVEGIKATFSIVPLLTRNQDEETVVTIDQEFELVGRRDFRSLLKQGLDSLPDEAEHLLVPITITYKDANGNHYRSECELTYKRWVATACLKRWGRIRSIR